MVLRGDVVVVVLVVVDVDVVLDVVVSDVEDVVAGGIVVVVVAGPAVVVLVAVRAVRVVVVVCKGGTGTDGPKPVGFLWGRVVVVVVCGGAAVTGTITETEVTERWPAEVGGELVPAVPPVVVTSSVALAKVGTLDVMVLGGEGPKEGGLAGDEAVAASSLASLASIRRATPSQYASSAASLAAVVPPCAGSLGDWRGPPDLATMLRTFCRSCFAWVVWPCASAWLAALRYWKADAKLGLFCCRMLVKLPPAAAPTRTRTAAATSNRTVLRRRRA